MAKALDRPRPKSTISDMIDGELIEQATQEASPLTPQAEEPIGPDPVPVAQGQGATPQRTGEHTDIQKMYRLTPTAQRTVQQLSMRLSTSLGFDVNNSVVVRSVLRAVHDALPEIKAGIEQQIQPQKQPSTAIGNEHARDGLEQAIADVLIQCINKFASSKPTE